MGQEISRRTVLRGAGAAGSVAAAAATLAACGSSGSGAGTPAASSAPSTAGTATGASTSAGATTAAAGASVPKAEVPVGGGKVVGGAVVTQPTAGTFKAFSSVCTHQGCTVRDVTSNQIHCPCHGSSFDANTGAVLSGPARAPLAAKTVTESGSNLLVS